MKAGLRLGVLLLLGVVTLLAFLPLFFAVSTYTNVAFQRVASSGSLAATRSLGQLLLSPNAPSTTPHTGDRVRALLDQSRALDSFVAVCVYDPTGRVTERVGSRQSTELCPVHLAPVAQAESQQLVAGQLLTTAHFGSFSLVTLAGPTPSSSPTQLLRIIGLYMGIFALALLGTSYVVLTHFLVRPLDELARAAKRVAEGARQFLAPLRGARELRELNQSLSTMTTHLVGREEALKKKVEEVELATESLRQAQERLIRSERLASVGRLAAGLAHEIGNPIAAILGLQELILSDQVDPKEQRDFVERMRKETERIHHILRDLLEFARPTRSEKGSVEPGDTGAAIQDTLALLAPQAAFRELEVSADVEPTLPPVTLAHEQLVQVFLNLVLNAADACGTTGTIRLTARQTERAVVVAVEDSGPGVPPELRDQIFEPFVTSKEVGKGSGLGLAVCRGLVEAAQGTITLDPSVGRGARFVVELPIAGSASSAFDNLNDYPPVAAGGGMGVPGGNTSAGSPQGLHVPSKHIRTPS